MEEIKTADVHGHTVHYDQTARPGIDYLAYDLSSEEADVFIEHAKNHGSAQFEDDHDHNFTLVKGSDGSFTLVLRKETGGGWF